MGFSVVFLIALIIVLGIALWQKETKKGLLIAALGISIVLLSYMAFAARIANTMP